MDQREGHNLNRKLSLIGDPTIQLYSRHGNHSDGGAAQGDPQRTRTWGMWAREGFASVIASLSTRATADYEAPAAAKATKNNNTRVRDMSSFLVSGL